MTSTQTKNICMIKRTDLGTKIAKNRQKFSNFLRKQNHSCIVFKCFKDFRDEKMITIFINNSHFYLKPNLKIYFYFVSIDHHLLPNSVLFFEKRVDSLNFNKTGKIKFNFLKLELIERINQNQASFWH
ncbi:hypothetical protein BpHYR1_049140 [Brachionus plicatilis]|uniref:Uncharacterized protein n=1 Tax=Brachionus plicatilis TaxID=10195 RepID=A0A3M7SKD7_BRAPC|nr:hypothetical protein BpHYR1_049140 [Brachionus plicatilis]